MELPDIEVVRALPEVRASDDTDSNPVLSGHLSVFNTWYEVHSIWEGHFLEQIAPGAFAETMAENRDAIKVTFNHGHDPTMGDQVLGPIRELREDTKGAYYEVPLFSGVPDLLLDGLRAGVYGSSFRFRVTAESWDDEPGESEHNPSGLPERTITRVDMSEFGPVTYPANPDATAQARSAPVSLTDEFYERLALREPARHEAAVRAASTISTGRPGTRSAGGGGSNDTSEVSPPNTPQPAAPPAGAPERNQTVEETTFSMTVDERRARRREIRERLSEIDAEHNGAELPSEVQAEWDTLTDEDERHSRAVTAAEERRARLAEIAEHEGNREAPYTPAPARNGRRGVPAVHRDHGDIFDLTELRKQARSVDDLGDLYRENARRAVDQARFPGVQSREAAQTQVERLLATVDDDHGTLARRVLITGSPTYQRAFGKATSALSTAGLTAEEQRALAVGTDSAGGYAVPFELDPTVILTSDGSINPLRQISRVEQIMGKTWQGVTSAGITVSRAAEAAESSDDAPTLAQPEVTPTRVQGFVPFSIEVDGDWPAMRSEMTSLLADAKEQEEAGSFAHGDGTGNNPSGVIATLAGSSHVDTAAVGTFAVEDIYSVKNALPPRFRARAQWVADTAIFDEVRQFDEAGGSSLWVQLQDGLPARLVGFPAHELTTMDAVVEEGAEILLIGDFQQFLIVDRIGMSVELVPHLFGPNGRPTGQRGLYAIWRNSSVILTPNAFRLLVVQANGG